MPSDESDTARPALSRERVIAAAVRVADAGGLAAVSMRRVAREAGVEAMSLYHHVTGKDDLLDALAETVYGQIDLTCLAQPWRPAMVARAISARQVFTAHPWALGLAESRTNAGPALLRHHDAVLGALVRGGFDARGAMRAFSAIDAYVYGFALTEQNLPFDADAGVDPELLAHYAALIADLPHLAAVLTEVVSGPAFRYGDEFLSGLDLILDGLEAQLASR